MSITAAEVIIKRADQVRAGDIILEPPLIVGQTIIRDPFLRYVHDVQIFGDEVIINNWDKMTSVGNELLIIERNTK